MRAGRARRGAASRPAGHGRRPARPTGGATRLYSPSALLLLASWPASASAPAWPPAAASWAHEPAGWRRMALELAGGPAAAGKTLIELDDALDLMLSWCATRVSGRASRSRWVTTSAGCCCCCCGADPVTVTPTACWPAPAGAACPMGPMP